MNPKKYKSIVLILLAWLLLTGAAASEPVALAQPGQSFLFIENVGQFAGSTRFQMFGGPAGLALTADALWLTLLQPVQIDPAAAEPADVITAASSESGVNLRLSFENANPAPRLEPFNRLDTRVAYFTGSDPANWQTDVPAWGGVRYVDLYPGLDLEITGENGQLVQRLVAHSGGDAVSAQSLTEVALRVEGAEALALTGEQLRLTTALGEVTLPLLQVEPGDMQIASAPAPQLEGDVIRQPFAGAGAVDSGVQIAAASDLRFSTFLGGSGNMDSARDLAVNAAGQAFVVGEAYAGFPTTPGSFDTSIDGVEGDAYVVKLNPDGSGLEYATFLGGSDFDIGWSIALDEADQAYVTGFTKSADFPTTFGAVDTEYGGNSEAFVVKLNAAGADLLYATMLGGNQAELATGIAIDPAGAAYVTGFTESPDFPTTPDAFDTGLDVWYDIFVTKLNADATALAYSTLVGGNNADYTWDLAVDSAGSAYVTGYTHSTDFPVTPGAFDTSYDNQEVFVVKVNIEGTGLDYATFLGGSGAEYAMGITVDAGGSAYLTGMTRSADFPVTAGAYDTTYNTTAEYSGDSFIARLVPDGSAVDYATFLGGSNDDVGHGIALDEAGNIYVTGYTTSPDFPTTLDAFDPSCDGCADAYAPPDVFVARLTADGATLTYATFLGGSSYDRAEGIAVDTANHAYVTGDTSSYNFPTTFGAFDRMKSGFNDAFVAKLAMTGGGSAPTPVPAHNCAPAALGQVMVGDTPRGLAVDEVRQRVYVANFGSDSVSVIDSQTNSVIETISGVSAATGIAHDPLHNMVWVTNYSANQVTPIEVNANATEFSVLPAVDVGAGPWGVVYNPIYGQVYVANSLDSSVSVINAGSQTVAATLTGRFNQPFHLATNPVTGKVYVANFGNNSVTVINGSTVSKTVDLYDSGRPYGIAVDEQRNLVYVATIAANRIVAIGSLHGQPDQFLGWAAFYRGFGNRNRPVPLRVIAVNPTIPPGGDGGHIWATTAAVDGSEQNQVLLIPKGWTSYFHYPLAQGVGQNPTDGIAIDRLRNRVYVSGGAAPGAVSVFGDNQVLCSNVGPASAAEAESEFDFDLFVRETMSQGDVTGDGLVDIFDLAFIAARFHRAEPAADVNNDGQVDILDLSLAARHYRPGESGAN
ncbi:MAG: SBBP repeat-containing protein [Chloroflexota bacterium]